MQKRDSDNVVNIATHYRLDGPEIGVAEIFHNHPDWLWGGHSLL
jgi:hypothetical protein